MASGIIFEEIECKTIINKTNTPGLGFNWSINPYRGCQHACVYCFARGTHEYLGYDSGRDFESRIIVKTNAATALAEQLRRPGWTIGGRSRTRVRLDSKGDETWQLGR